MPIFLLSRHSETTSEEGLVENGDIAIIYLLLTV
jgi:hypothetical protein